MEYLSYIKPSCTSFSSFADTKSMLAWVFKSIFGFAFGTDFQSWNLTCFRISGSLLKTSAFRRAMWTHF